MLILIWGEVWRISKPQLKKLLKDFLAEATHEGIDPNNYGAKRLGEAMKLTDMSDDHARNLLDKLEK